MTIRVGINWTHPDTRVSQMPAFGRDQMLPREDVLKVASYVYSLSHPGAKDVDPARVEAGKAIFAANCVACHGDNAKGNPEVGAPDLTDRFWNYVSPRKTQQRRDKPFKVPAIPSNAAQRSRVNKQSHTPKFSTRSMSRNILSTHR